MIQLEATFITYFKWAVSLFVVVIAAWLVFLNRDSEKVMQTFLSALAIGTVGVLITILFSLKEEMRELEFPTLFTYERASLMPWRPGHITFLYPPSEMYASIHLQALAKLHPEVFMKGKDNQGTDLYGDVALRLVFDSLVQVFSMNWDQKITSINLPVVNRKTFGPNQPGVKSDVKSWDEIAALFPKSYALRAPVFGVGKFAVPPGTEISGKEERFQDGGLHKTSILLVNKFVDVEIVIAFIGGEGTIGMYSLVTNLSEEETLKFWTSSYLISMKAKFNAYRSGHPDMPKYKNWVNNIFETVRDQLDSQRSWERAKDLLTVKTNLH
jgi:hypothetical protein